MSPKMSSLAFDDMTEVGLSHETVFDFTPELVVVKSRNGLGNEKQFSFNKGLDSEIVHVKGKFTVSF